MAAIIEHATANRSPAGFIEGIRRDLVRRGMSAREARSVSKLFVDDRPEFFRRVAAYGNKNRKMLEWLKSDDFMKRQIAGLALEVETERILDKVKARAKRA